jgi:YesN/AraC family two-component response regulator
MIKVLLADDEYWILENLKNIISWQEHSFELLEPAQDGESALASIRENQPDIVITDVNMPFISGIELIEQARVEYPETLFIVLSGYSDFKYVRSALVVGALDYLLKPVSKSDLLEVLEKAANRISESKKQKLEQHMTREKLRIASMSVIDRELSQLIHSGSDAFADAQMQARLAEYELGFAGFTLVVFRVAELSKILRTSEMKELDWHIYRIKDLISKQASGYKNLVFNYTYRNNEFILITDKDKPYTTCSRIIKALTDLTGFPVVAVIGQHSFSFFNLRESYNNALLAFFAMNFDDNEKIVYACETQDCAVAKRMSAEQEKRLQLSASSGNRVVFQEIVMNEIKLLNCKKDMWRIVEVSQTTRSIARILCNSLPPNAKASQVLTLENLTELLQAAVNTLDIEEMSSILGQMLDEVFESVSQPKQSEGIKHTVVKVKDYIDNQYFEDLSLTMLSEQFHVESTYLSKAFKYAYGDNLMLYIAKKRMERAKEYLKNHDLNITEISQLVGYGDYAYFSRVFRKLTGQCPREFREGAEHVV